MKKPAHPRKPVKQTKDKEIVLFETYGYSNISVGEIIKHFPKNMSFDGIFIRVNSDEYGDYYDHSNLEFFYIEKFDHEKEEKSYLEKMKKFDKEMKNYEKQKKLYKQYQEKNEIQKLEEKLEKLKEKLKKEK